MFEDIQLENRGPIAWLTLNRPQKLNTLRIQTLKEITAAVQAVEADDSVKVLVITGTGDRAFSAGIFVDELADMDAMRAHEFHRIESQAYRSVLYLEKPCIAAVNGYALGGGCVLAMAADIRIATDTAVFGLTELNMGAPVPVEGALLPLLVGHGRAREIILTARHVPVDEAVTIGLCNRAVPAEDLYAVVDELAQQIARFDLTALRVQKDIMHKWLTTDLNSAIDYSISAMSLVFASGGPRTAINDFLEKRRLKNGR
jgi:enoyl-CoA hydratase